MKYLQKNKDLHTKDYLFVPLTDKGKKGLIQTLSNG